WHDEGMPARCFMVCGHDELEDWCPERLSEADQRGGFLLGAAAVLGNDNRLRAPGEQGGDLVELRRWRQHRLRLDSRARLEGYRAHKEVEGHAQERGSLGDSISEVESTAKLMYQIARRLGLLGPLDAQLAIARRAREVYEKGRPLRTGVKRRDFAVSQ